MFLEVILSFLGIIGALIVFVITFVMGIEVMISKDVDKDTKLKMLYLWIVQFVLICTATHSIL